MLRHLSPQQGYPGLEQFLLRLLSAYLPLVAPPIDAPWIRWEEGEGRAAGTFWSKGRGVAIDLSIRRGTAPRVSSCDDTELESHGLLGRIRELPALERAQFRM
jgi:hypothetical protein